jgi:hypothetical protein
MPTPVIAGLARVAFIYQSAAPLSNPVNVMHFGIGTGLTDLLQAISDNWDNDQLDCCSLNLTLTRLEGKSLDTDFGPQEELILPVNAKFVGDGNADGIPQVAAIVKHTTASGGRSFRGRTFLPLVSEDKTDSGALLTASTVTTAWETFRTAMATDGFPLKVASYRLELATNVTASVCEGRTATQRRRNKR